MGVRITKETGLTSQVTAAVLFVFRLSMQQTCASQDRDARADPKTENARVSEQR